MGRTSSILAAALMVFSGLAFAGEPAAAPTVRAISLGEIVGNDDSAASGTYVWKGVPFAQAPVGGLRWRSPVDPAPWAKPRAAQQFGSACASSGRLDGPGRNNRYDETIATSLDQTVGSEDCLYLNVWRPATQREQLPVIVFVHGGSNVSGYTADPLYDGAALARTADAVVVTVNYRLGIFGFFRSPQLRTGNAEEDSGNFALLDILHALKFVQREIAAFGGDPANVTLMGESAGAVNVYALLTSPLMLQAQPRLAHRVLPMSGGISRAEDLPPGAVPVLLDPAYFDEQARLLLVHLLINDGLARDEGAARAYIEAHKAEELAAYLRGKSTDTVLAQLLKPLKAVNRASSGPIADGLVMSKDPIGAIRGGRYLQVPVLAGNTRDETKLFASLLALSPALGGVSGRMLSDTELFALAARYDPDAPPQLRIEQWIPARYLPVNAPGTGFNARTQFLNDYWFSPLRDSALNALRSRQAQVWHYRFDWSQAPAPFNEIYGASHAFDLFFAFGNFGPSVLSRLLFNKANEAGRLALSDAMMRSIGAFARKGDPNDAALGVDWPAWPRSLLFDASPTAKRITVTR
ncbi:carboxylesterase/lipase family protein [Burkholderiaceae bacterium UC74_6]